MLNETAFYRKGNLSCCIIHNPPPPKKNPPKPPTNVKRSLSWGWGVRGTFRGRCRCDHDRGDRLRGACSHVLLQLLRLDGLDANLNKHECLHPILNLTFNSRWGGGERGNPLTCVAWPCCWSCWNCWAVTKLTGLFPAISFVPAGTEVRMMFLPRLLILLSQREADKRKRSNKSLTSNNRVPQIWKEDIFTI